jgi:predicted DCC family thiol-disulfide oxidoreductase YuxK
MESLQHKIIIYDDVCPLCKAYTKGFVQLGWLLPGHRLGFSEVSPDLLARIDLDRARHEIPLLDLKTGETLYGKDALFFIFGEAMPWLKPLFRFGIFKALVFALYQIITYNRRIIAGSRKPQTGFDCAPDFNAFYRWLYIGIATSIGSGLLWTSAIPPQAVWVPIAALAGVLFYRNFEGRTLYVGHWATVLLIAALLLRIVGVNVYSGVLVGLLSVYLLIRRLI